MGNYTPPLCFYWRIRIIWDQHLFVHASYYFNILISAFNWEYLPVLSYFVSCRPEEWIWWRSCHSYSSSVSLLLAEWVHSSLILYTCKKPTSVISGFKNDASFVFLCCYWPCIAFVPQDYSVEGMSESLLTFLQHLREFGLVFQRKVRHWDRVGRSTNT